MKECTGRIVCDVFFKDSPADMKECTGRIVCDVFFKDSPAGRHEGMHR